MIVQYNIKNLPEKEKAFFEQYASKRIQSLAKWVKKFPEDSIIMDIHIEKFATKEAYLVKMKLVIPGNEFYATEDDHTIEEAVDKTKDKIKRQYGKNCG